MSSLRHLGLQNYSRADQLLDLLVGSRLLEQVDTLDLSMGTLTDRGGARLLRNYKEFMHLVRLDLSANALERTVAQLTERFSYRLGIYAQREDQLVPINAFQSLSP